MYKFSRAFYIFVMRKILVYISLIPVSFLTLTCSEDESGTVPKLTTLPITNISLETAESGGNITSDGGSEITARGVCWSTTDNPTIGDDKSSDGIGSGEFTSNLILVSGTTYYARAYATNKSGTGYGNVLSFTTPSFSITTESAFVLSRTEAVVEGSVLGTGFTERGICWSLTDNPTTADNKKTSNSENGSFTITLTELFASTKYFARAYAINEAGTNYGESISFNTKNQFKGVYEITDGEVVINTATGIDPILSGNYNEGLEMQLGEISNTTVSILPQYRDGSSIGGTGDFRLTINKSVVLSDGSHPVTISSVSNATLINSSEENKFFPGLPGTSGASEQQEFLLNFEWMSVTNPSYKRSVKDLRIKSIDLE